MTQHKGEHLGSVIKPQILASIAIKNLLSKRLRTSLTVMGIVIGVGAVVFLVSLALGLHEVVNQQVIGSKSVNSIDVTTPNATTIVLDNTSANKISQFGHVNTVAPAYILAGKISYQGSQSDTVVYGTTNQYINLSALKFVAGAHTLKASNDAIVNTALLNLIGQTSPGAAINKKLTVQTAVSLASGSQKTVTSSLKVAGVVSTGAGAEVFQNSQTFTNAGTAQYGQLKVLADNRKDVPALRQQINGLGLTTASPLDTLSQINTIFTIFTFVVVGFGGIGMVIAILGMFNTLTISLLERTSEIGLMITMGARKADVQRLLIFEALLLSMCGGFGGLVAAWFIGEGINVFLTQYANGRGVDGSIHAFSITPLLVLATVLLTIIVGLLVSFYPARRAARINPIEALRHE
ncbi:MAG TPA: FtsX-like permease family protein [Candidatus Saccharimonadales bacterium]